MSRRRVLLVEDEESISDPLAAALEREGFAPIVAPTAAAGLESFRRLEAIQQEGGSAAEQAAKAQAELTRLNELVEDLLELARASSVDVTGERLDLGEVARAVVDRWTGPAASSGKRIVERIGTPSHVWANSEDLGHVLDNLLENSIRYCPSGTEITVEAEGDGRPRLVVSDTGPGIPPEDRDRIFERFYRGSTGKEAGAGTGLGLAVVAELIHRWGGRGPGDRRAGHRHRGHLPDSTYHFLTIP